MIPYYMVRRLAPNLSHLTKGLVKYVAGRGYFLAVSSQNGDKYVAPPPPPQPLNSKSVYIYNIYVLNLQLKKMMHARWDWCRLTVQLCPN